MGPLTGELRVYKHLGKIGSFSGGRFAELTVGAVRIRGCIVMEVPCGYKHLKETLAVR